MDHLTIAACLLFGIAFSISLFHYVPVLTRQNARENDAALKQELKNVSQMLFDIDETNFLPFVQIDYQGQHKTSNLTVDRAENRLLTVNESVYDYEIIRKMKILYDNFEAISSIDENFTPQEEIEENEFIELLLETPVMNLALEFLEEHGFSLATHEDRFQMIKKIWFEFYPRNKNTLMTSSGFEHVFLSEIKRGKIIGLHNWIYFAEAEKRGQLNYKGWMKVIDLGEKGQIAKITFSLNGLTKTVSSMLIGTSPELEMAIFTICFKLRPNKGCQMEFSGKTFTVTTHTFDHNGKKLLASAYVNL